MKRIAYCITAIVMITMITSCSVSEIDVVPSPTVEVTPVPTIKEPTAEELRLLIEKYTSENDYESVYKTALELIKLTPEDAEIYTTAANALLEMSNANAKEMNRILMLGVENSGDNAVIIAEWAKENAPEISIDMPFIQDYYEDEINTEGITTGNMTNAAKYKNNWWQSGLLTWQGDWVYLAQPNDDFAIYKVRSDGSEYQKVGEAHGHSLNVVGDWIYYVDIQDECPCKIRTDGSMGTKLIDEVCGSISVSGDWIYFYSDRLYKIRTDGTEKTTITDDFAIFTCVHGDWVYYCVKSETGGLWRISINGGKPEQVVPGFVMTYCIVDDWVYYVDLNNWQNICRVHTDGTSAEVFLPFGQRIITFNIADGILYINYNVSSDEQDGFTIGSEISAIDMVTLENLQYIQADTEPLCTGPEGMLYFFKLSEGMQWYSMDENGQIAKVGSEDIN